jgi:hypothetical protein
MLVCNQHHISIWCPVPFLNFRLITNDVICTWHFILQRVTGFAHSGPQQSERQTKWDSPLMLGCRRKKRDAIGFFPFFGLSAVSTNLEQRTGDRLAQESDCSRLPLIHQAPKGTTGPQCFSSASRRISSNPITPNKAYAETMQPTTHLVASAENILSRLTLSTLNPNSNSGTACSSSSAIFLSPRPSPSGLCR